MKQIEDTYLVKNASGSLVMLLKSYDGKYFIGTHIVGEFKHISIEEAMILVNAK